MSDPNTVGYVLMHDGKYVDDHHVLTDNFNMAAIYDKDMAERMIARIAGRDKWTKELHGKTFTVHRVVVFPPGE